MLKHTCLVLLLSHEFVNLSRNVEDDLSKRIFTSLVKVLDYIYENRHEMNVDGLFGVIFTRINLENLNGDLEFVDTKFLNSERDKVSKILKASEFPKISLDVKHKIFLKYVLDPNIWQKNITFTSANFKKDFKMLATKLNVRTCDDFTKHMRNDYFSEETSDQCMIQLIKSSIITPYHCTIDQLCNAYMIGNTDDYVPAYGNTHRCLLNTVIESQTEARQCNWNKKWLAKRIKEYCLYIYWEAQKNSECGFIPEFDDLFLEQILLCGYEGYTDLLPVQWMEYVLSIQTKHGCFGIFTPSSYDNRKSELRRRRKRESNVIQFGCLDHTTGLGAGVLSLFLRFLAGTDEKRIPS